MCYERVLLMRINCIYETTAKYILSAIWAIHFIATIENVPNVHKRHGFIRSALNTFSLRIFLCEIFETFLR